jgi:prepilin-type N-terminal cleavage/methylation domain-containing protein
MAPGRPDVGEIQPRGGALMRASTRSPRGFTLIELLIAALATAVLVLGAASLLVAQQTTFRHTSSERAMNETGRIGLEHIARNLRAAGFGVDPGLVFDLGAQASARMDRGPSGGTFAAASLGCTTAISCRDRTDGPDELVFLSRDPSFGHALLAPGPTSGSTSLTLQGPLLQPLHQGQILQVMCYSGPMAWAYVTVGAEVAAAPAATSVDVPIASGGGTSYPFPLQNSLLGPGTPGNSCFANVATAGDATTIPSATKVFKVDRYRYFIQTHAADGTVVAWGTAGARPWLMLDHGVLDAGGNELIDVIAPDVEDLQVAYVFPWDTVNPLVGGTAGAAMSAGATSIDLSVSPPVYSDDLAAIARQSHHPANVRAVRVGIVTRSSQADTTLSNTYSVPALLNRPSLVGVPGFRRQVFETTIAVRNLDARAPYFPIWDTLTGNLNAGGG